LQHPSLKNPVNGFIEQSSSRSPRTFLGAFGRPPPFPLSSLSIADPWTPATFPIPATAGRRQWAPPFILGGRSRSCSFGSQHGRERASGPRLKLVSPEPEKRIVVKNRPAGRPPNRELRTREHLKSAEVERLIEAAKGNRRGHRDTAMILIAFRHGLRASELVDLRWEQTDLDQAVLHVRRVKNGTPATHPLTGRELRALRKLQRESGENPFVFVSERGAPFSVSGFRRLIERAAQAAGLEIKAHPHMLRHATGYALANRGTDTRTLQSYLGHRNISNTVRYTELAPGRFKNLWKD
jgi:integrase